MGVSVPVGAAPCNAVGCRVYAEAVAEPAPFVPQQNAVGCRVYAEAETSPLPPLVRGNAEGEEILLPLGLPNRNLKLIIAYDGTSFHGWQRQLARRTVQQEVETALSRIVCERVALVAASRTDAGVHALGQTANFRTASSIACDRLLRGLNSILPDSISVMHIEDVPPEFTSRNATGKHYRYRICRGIVDDPFNRRTRWRYIYPLDVDIMRETAKLMTGDVDFRGLQVKTGKVYESTIRAIWAIDLHADDHEIIVDIRGKAFMYKQVRSMVGLLVATGCGRVKTADVPALLSGEAGKRRSEVAPPQGLTLMEVYYGQNLRCTT